MIWGVSYSPDGKASVRGGVCDLLPTVRSPHQSLLHPPSTPRQFLGLRTAGADFICSRASPERSPHRRRGSVEGRLPHSLTLLGGATLAGPTGIVTGPAGQRRRLALLALLALARERRMSRDKLLALLWPEADTDKARHTLSVALHALRSQLAEDAIEPIGEELHLNEGALACDVWEFEAAIAASDVERAVLLYGGPFLDGVHLSGDAEEFERWADLERARLAGLFVSALERVARQRHERGDHRIAVEVWRRLVALDPYRAAPTLGLMRALELAGDRAAALQHARVHATLLREELGAEPEAEIVRLTERLRSSAASLAAPVVVVPPAVDVKPAASTSAREHASPARSESGAAAPETKSREGPQSHPPTQRRFRLRAVVAVGLVVLATATAVIALRTATPVAARSRTPTPAIGSLAVLPFASAIPEDQYLGDGMSDELMARLGTIDGLRLVSRTSAFAVKGKQDDVREIGRRLRADAVLEGGIRRSSSRVRVNVQLVSTESGHRLWSDTFDRPLDDVFRVQAEIAQAVVTTLRPWLGESAAPKARPLTNDVVAYDHYLKARYLLTRGGTEVTEASLREALRLLTLALARDSGFAAAYAVTARAYIRLSDFVPPRELLFGVRQAALRALALDSTDIDTRIALGKVRMIYDRDWPAAEVELRRAIAMDSLSAAAHDAYSNFLYAARRFDEGLAQARIGLRLSRDELSDSAYALEEEMLSALDAAYRGDLPTAVNRLSSALQHAPNSTSIRWRLGLTLVVAGRAAEAIPHLERVRDRTRGALPFLTHLGFAYGFAGRRAEAEAILRELQHRGASAYVPKDQIAALHLSLGRRAEALDWLERAADDNHWWMYQISQTPMWFSLYDEPRFLKLVDRLGAPRPTRHPTVHSGSSG